MAQTKRKRRNKHRGNAVGAVEARGRTSKPREEARAARGRSGSPTGRFGRPLKPPSWRSALTKALFGGVVLFLFARFGLLGQESSTQSALLLAGMALLFYTPIMFITDKWVYQRRLKQMSGAGSGARGTR